MEGSIKSLKVVHLSGMRVDLIRIINFGSLEVRICLTFVFHFKNQRFDQGFIFIIISICIEGKKCCLITEVLFLIYLQFIETSLKIDFLHVVLGDNKCHIQKMNCLIGSYIEETRFGHIILSLNLSI